jgi:hypothetical protein
MKILIIGLLYGLVATALGIMILASQTKTDFFPDGTESIFANEEEY